MDATYARQAALVIKAIPHVATENAFALKGGTAINLFERDLPRLSVDIDLTYTIISPRDEAIHEINAALERISRRLARFGINNRLTGSEVARKIVCTTSSAAVKIEPNFILRGTIFPTRRLAISPAAQKLFGQAKINILSKAELYGGKFCAAPLSHGVSPVPAPRDNWDNRDIRDVAFQFTPPLRIAVSDSRTDRSSSASRISIDASENIQITL